MTMATIPAPITSQGAAVGIVIGLENGQPLVIFPGSPEEKGIPARTTETVGSDDIGREVVLLFEGGDPLRPLIVGKLQPTGHEETAPRVSVILDGERILLDADKEIVLRCGKASITLTRAGKILIRGAYLLSRSSGVNRIKGGSVQIN